MALIISVMAPMTEVKGVGMILMQWHMNIDMDESTLLPEMHLPRSYYDRLPKSFLGIGLVLGNKT